MVEIGENEPVDEALVFEGMKSEEGGLFFEVTGLAQRGQFGLFRVLSEDEFEECLQYWDVDINPESQYA